METCEALCPLWVMDSCGVTSRCSGQPVARRIANKLTTEPSSPMRDNAPYTLGNFADFRASETMEISMDQELTDELLANPGTFWRTIQRLAARIPAKALIVLGVFLFAAGLMALHTALTRKDSSLRVKVQHNFRSAQLSVWLDGDLSYSGRLTGSSRRKLGFIESVQGSLSETFTVSAGMHEVRVRVSTEDGSAQENTIRGEFAANSQQTLVVVARGDDISMNWLGHDQGTASTSSPVAEPVPPSPGWFQRYAGSLALSIVGSIISAFTGYAIRELPKQITARQAAPPKTHSASAGQ